MARRQSHEEKNSTDMRARPEVREILISHKLQRWSLIGQHPHAYPNYLPSRARRKLKGCELIVVVEQDFERVGVVFGAPGHDERVEHRGRHESAMPDLQVSNGFAVFINSTHEVRH